MEKLSLLFTTHKCSTAAVSQFSHCFLCTAIVRFLCPSVACYRFSYAGNVPTFAMFGQIEDSVLSADFVTISVSAVSLQST